MPNLQLGQHELSYVSDGEGFPLVLIPDTHGTVDDWSGALPLLGELCRVIAYEYHQRQPSLPESVVTLLALLEALAIPRAYLAGYGRGAQTALHCAQYRPSRLEALMLIGMDSIPPLPARPPRIAEPAGDPLPLSGLGVPTCILAGEAAPEHRRCAAQLATQLPRSVSITVPGAHSEPHRDQPLPLGHAMLDFLTQCERQRNLVRGASFLL